MVMRAAKLKNGGKVPGATVFREPENGPLRVFSQLGSENNGSSQASTEEKPSLNGFQEVGIGEDAAKKDKVKPLSSLDSNKALKRSSSPHVRHSSLKVIRLGLLCCWVVCSLIVGGSYLVGFNGRVLYVMI